MMQLIVLSGLSGSGKSVALKMLEDLGYTCVDNLPAGFLTDWCQLLCAQGVTRMAASIDVRGRQHLAALPAQIAQVEALGVGVRLLFLDAGNEALIKRFSETRRNHPLSHSGKTVLECIAEEREVLADIAMIGHRIDTSRLSSSALRQWVRQFARVDQSALILIFQSFAFKQGVPLDADFVFDVRCLPNPHYDPLLRPLTGRDQPVVEFLRASSEVEAMFSDIEAFIRRWLPAFINDNRHFLTVAIGCTGGQHRSVYLAEQLAAVFWASREGQVLVRHREITVAEP